MRTTLTDRRIKEAKPQAKPWFMWDGKISGLGVKINPTGASVYVLQYRVGRNRKARRLTMPQTKTGRRVHDLPAPTLAVLASQPRIDNIPWVFGTRTAPLSYNTTRRVFVEVTLAAGLRNVRLHDLRRTVMTNAAMAGVGTHILRDLLGHRTTAMADRYVRAVGNPVRDARERVGAAMAAMMGGTSGDAVPLRRAV